MQDLLALANRKASLSVPLAATDRKFKQQILTFQKLASHHRRAPRSCGVVGELTRPRRITIDYVLEARSSLWLVKNEVRCSIVVSDPD